MTTMFSSILHLAAYALLTTTSSALPSFFTLTPYAPTSAHCPTTPLVRSAGGLSADEAWYRDHRSATASQSLREWFTTFNTELSYNETFPVENMPVVGFASSGGSVRALLSESSPELGRYAMRIPRRVLIESAGGLPTPIPVQVLIKP